MPTRTARTSWTGGLQDGAGTVALVSSGLGSYEVSFPRRAADDVLVHRLSQVRRVAARRSPGLPGGVSLARGRGRVRLAWNHELITQGQFGQILSRAKDAASAYQPPGQQG